MRPVMALFMLLLAVWPYSNSAHATGIYKWVDAHGKVHYGDKPSVETVEEVDIKGQNSGALPPPTDAQRRIRQQRLLNVFQEDREAARARVQKEKQREVRAQRNCNLARDRLRSLRQAAYLYDLDKQGNRVILPDQKMEKAISGTEAAVNRWCE
jgi:hypothetical protein